MPLDLDHDEREDREGTGDRQVAGRRGAPRHQAQQVHVQDEEEERRHEGRELGAVVPDVGDDDVVPDEEHQPLDRGGESLRRFLVRLLPLEAAACNPQGGEHQDRGDHHEDDVLGGRKIQGERSEVHVGPLLPVQHELVVKQPLQAERVRVRRVMEDELADVDGFLGGLRCRLVSLKHHNCRASKKSSGTSTPMYPIAAGSAGKRAESSQITTPNQHHAKHPESHPACPPSREIAKRSIAPMLHRPPREHLDARGQEAEQCGRYRPAPPREQKAEKEYRDRECQPGLTSCHLLATRHPGLASRSRAAGRR